MESKKIIVTGGIGREVNPYSHKFSSMEYKEFELNVQSCPVINPKVDGEYTARKIWQMEDPETKEWYHVYCMAHMMEDKESPVREVWEIVEGEPHTTITEHEVQEWCAMPITDAAISRLTELLTGEYSLKDARNDILSFRKDG